MSRSFARSVHICYEKKGLSLKFSAPLTYPAHVMLAKLYKKRYRIDHRYTLFGFLSVKTAELRGENGPFKVVKSVYLYWPTLLHVRSLQLFVPLTSGRFARKERITIPG